MIDYAEIISNLDDKMIFNLLEQLGGEPEDKGEVIISRTICHNDIDGSKKLYYYKNTHLFVCYTSCGNMSIFKLLREYYDTRNIQYDWYNDIFKLITECSSANLSTNQPIYHTVASNYQKNKMVELPVYPNGIIDVFPKEYPDIWKNDGISESAMDRFNIRFSSINNKIIIPHYNVKNQLVGIRGRALNTDEVELVGKYMPVQIEQKWYSHPLSLNLYGLNNNIKNINQTGICFLAEGEKSCLQSESFTIPNCTVAICGSQFNKRQNQILLTNCHIKELIICFDKEQDDTDNYFMKLYNLCNKYKNYYTISFVYDHDNLLKNKDSPFDNGEEIFQKLISKRVKVN